MKKKTLSKSFVKSQNFKCHTITILIMKLKKSRIIIVTLKKNCNKQFTTTTTTSRDHLPSPFENLDLPVITKARVFSPVFILCFYLATSNSDGTSEHSLNISQNDEHLQHFFSSPADLQTESLGCTYMGKHNAIHQKTSSSRMVFNKHQ